MIDAGKIAQLKEKTDLAKLFSSYGHEPKMVGTAVKVLCPFHEDESPSLSINAKKNLWKCFGCGESGDAISLVQKLDGISFPAAAHKLASEHALQISIDQLPINETPTQSLRSEDYELLQKVAGFYHRVFTEKPDGRDYLNQRGIDPSLLTDYQIGYVDGTILTATPKEMVPQLKSLGLLLDNGRERFLGCVVFPLFDLNGNVVSFYGRHLKDGHFYLPGPRRGLFNPRQLILRQAQRPNPLIITESVIDACSFIAQGIPNVFPIYGTNGVTDDHVAYLKHLRPSRIILALDGDDQGQRASEQLKERLQTELSFSFSCERVCFPENMDANEYFQSHTSTDFESLLIGQPVISKEPKTKPPKLTTNKYQLKHIEQKKGKLSVTIKVDHPSNGRFVLDTVNLYSQRQRDSFIKSVASLLNEKEDVIAREVTDLIRTCEEKSKDPAAEKECDTPEISSADEQEALRFLKNPDLFSEIINDYETLGYIGEESNKQLAYLVMTSRKLQNPLSLVIVSNSAAGKSFLQKATMSFCPKEDGKYLTRLTQQSLYYLGEESLKHKFLSIEEEEGASDASYSLKTLLSAKELRVISTSQDPVTGKKRADEYMTEGPVAVMVSTTNPDIEPEFASRTMVISIDESKEQTGGIHHSQRILRTVTGIADQLKENAIAKKHHNSQRLLKSDLRVVNNHAPGLKFPVDRLKYRRAHAHYLDLIDTVAYLRQYQKTVKNHDGLFDYVEVDDQDIGLAKGLYKILMGWHLDELSPPTRRLLKQIVQYCEQQDSKEFSRREIREAYKWGNTHLHNHLNKLVELEYLVPITGANGSKYRYELIYVGTESDLATIEELLEI